ncbi:MAG: insulinase family protein [Desulfobacterales bacterium]|nr:insulinase family protein [Desulfobacterales bacterium]
MPKRLLTLVLFLMAFISLNPCISFAQKDDSIKVFALRTGILLLLKEVKQNPIVAVELPGLKQVLLMKMTRITGFRTFLSIFYLKEQKNIKPAEMDRILESKGAVFNAATSKDFTHYYTTINSKYLETALELQADMLFNAIIPEDEALIEERLVVQEEEIRRAEDNPNRILFNNLNSYAF